MENVLAFEQHPRVKVNEIQNDLHNLSRYLEGCLENDLTTDELYDILGELKNQCDILKEF